VHLLAERLGERHRVVNASVSGDTTKEGMARFAALLAVHEPDIVVIELGGNDGLRGFPIADIRANLLAMAHAARRSGAEPVIAGMEMLPNYGPRYTDAFRAVFREVAVEMDAPLVPFLLEGVAVAAEDEGLMQDDGIHPTAKAQERLLYNVWEVLEPLLAD
jgi:acyl-CoA thioesterase-1